MVQIKVKNSHLLGTRTADVRAEHDLVGWLSMHVLLVQLAVKHFQVTTSAVNVLFMLDWELHNKGLPSVAEWLELAGEGVEPRVFWSLQTYKYQGVRIAKRCGTWSELIPMGAFVNYLEYKYKGFINLLRHAVLPLSSSGSL